MRAALVSFSIDGNNVLSFLPHLKDNRHRPHRFTSLNDKSEESIILENFVSCLKGDTPHSILDGIKCLELVYEIRLNQ